MVLRWDAVLWDESRETILQIAVFGAIRITKERFSCCCCLCISRQDTSSTYPCTVFNHFVALSRLSATLNILIPLGRIFKQIPTLRQHISLNGMHKPSRCQSPTDQAVYKTIPPVLTIPLPSSGLFIPLNFIRNYVKINHITVS